jgi:hypothetical protein
MFLAYSLLLMCSSSIGQLKGYRNKDRSSSVEQSLGAEKSLITYSNLGFILSPA